MKNIALFDQFHLEVINNNDAASLFYTIDNNRAYLSEWLTFIPHMHSAIDTLAYIESVTAHTDFKRQPVYTFKFNKELIGIIGFKDWDLCNSSAEMGYWLIPKHQKKESFQHQ